MKEAAASFLDDMLNDREPRWLSLLGTSGAGKTMLSRLIYAEFKQRKHAEINERASSSIRIVRYRGGFMNWGKAINDRMLKGEFDFLDDMRDYIFFVIDDIASEHERHRELSASKLYNVLESRMRKWTIITANLSLDQIGSKLDTRIASRMLRNGSAVIDVDVPDFNLR